MKYSKGIMWLDDCRIPFVDNNEIPKKSNDGFKNWASYYQREWEGSKDLFPNQQGRFTPNLLVCDDMLNDGIIGGNNSNKFYEPQYEDTSNIYGKYKQLQVTQYKDKGSSSRYYDLDKWFDKIIDEIR
jgi:hypothetical protein